MNWQALARRKLAQVHDKKIRWGGSKRAGGVSYPYESKDGTTFGEAFPNGVFYCPEPSDGKSYAIWLHEFMHCLHKTPVSTAWRTETNTWELVVIDCINEKVRLGGSAFAFIMLRLLEPYSTLRSKDSKDELIRRVLALLLTWEEHEFAE